MPELIVTDSDLSDRTKVAPCTLYVCKSDRPATNDGLYWRVVYTISACVDDVLGHFHTKEDAIKFAEELSDPREFLGLKVQNDHFRQEIAERQGQLEALKNIADAMVQELKKRRAPHPDDSEGFTTASELSFELTQLRLGAFDPDFPRLLTFLLRHYQGAESPLELKLQVDSVWDWYQIKQIEGDPNSPTLWDHLENKE